MLSGASAPRFESKLLLRLGVVWWWLCALACVWQVLALQVPGSPYRAGLLAGPIDQLRAATFMLGTGALVLSLLWPRLYAEGRGRVVLGLLVLGSVIHTLALIYAASQGLIAVQLLDTRDDARWALYARALGHGLVWLALSAVCLRAFSRTRPPEGS